MFTEIVDAGSSKHFDILGIKMFDSCEIRVHPTGKVIARFGTKSQGQGHETTYAQIIAFYVKGSPNRSRTIQEIAFATYTNHPQGMEAGQDFSALTPAEIALSILAEVIQRVRQGHLPSSNQPVHRRAWLANMLRLRIPNQAFRKPRLGRRSIQFAP